MFEIINNIKRNFKYKDLLRQLVTRDLKLKYRRSFLGYLWSVLNPLLVMIVMTIVFSKLFKRNIENFPVYLFSGQLIFNYMNSSTHLALGSIVDNGALLKKTYVPKGIFTLAKVSSSLVDFVFSLAALFIVMIVTKAKFSLTLLFIPIVIIQLFVFCLGLGFFLAQAYVFFRDIKYIYNAITTAWVYLTPVIYPMEVLPDLVAKWVSRVNPMYFYVSQFRAIVYDGVLPDEQLIMGGIVSAIISILIGVLCFRRSQDRFILYI
ncbi:ABC transporter permease [Lachnoclostridium phytofermentans]|uniref:ABC transporter permease n=1 Tax=Lachnoclostridium phytofermentans TaxID=66219 RepID=UPI000B23C27C|nr:ABC transporter permease [Lachnoclostridium phytofermentans]